MLDSKDIGRVFVAPFSTWDETVFRLLHAAGLGERLAPVEKVLIKPNLVEPLPPPITTPVALVRAITAYIHACCPNIEIYVGEGCGSSSNNTEQVFELLGYGGLAALPRVRLVDLNEAPLVRKENSDCNRWPSMHLPQIVFDSFLISVPVLKAHSLAGATLTMKNMIGLAPPAHYQQGGSWKKSSFHRSVQEAVFDLNRYRTPDFSVLDATVGMQVAHLWGPTCDPPPNRLAVSYDPVAIDTYGCGLLGINWQSVSHIAMAHTILGSAEPLAVTTV